MVQTHGQCSARLRSGSMDCGVKFKKQAQTTWQTMTSETGTTPHLVASLHWTTATMMALLTWNLKCDNQVGLVVDGDIMNNQGIMRCTTNITGLTTLYSRLSTDTNYVGVYEDSVITTICNCECMVYIY